MTEGLGWWSPPVPVRGARIGITDNVTHAVRAIEKLDEWGGMKNSKLKRAIKVCSDALEGNASIHDARKAFLEAARSTGNLMSYG